MGLLCGNCKYERPSHHRGADTSCPLCNTPYPTGLAAPAIGGVPLSKASNSRRNKTIVIVAAVALLLGLAIVNEKYHYYANYQYDHLLGFDRPDRARAAEDMVRTFYSDKGASVVEVTLIKESTRKMKGYAILGDRYHAEHQNQRNCTVELDADMEKLLLTCEVSR